MKKFNLILTLSTISIVMLLFFPVTENVTVSKEHITSNRVFAGKINNEVVGTDLCCKYWLEKDSMPELETYHVTKPLLLGCLGFIYSCESFN
tara:strand:+ start:710 stop:985 length:276 start_codon:yes stop_codon:yes gene_type:complete